MEIIQEKGSVVALGNFDGLHIGHMAVINAAEKMAREQNLNLVIATFAEHPMKFLTGIAPIELLTGSLKEKIFTETGAKICHFDFLALKDMEPGVFLSEVLISMLNAKGVCCGFNYSFGAKGKVRRNFLNHCVKKQEYFLTCQRLPL